MEGSTLGPAQLSAVCSANITLEQGSAEQGAPPTSPDGISAVAGQRVPWAALALQCRDDSPQFAHTHTVLICPHLNMLKSACIFHGTMASG